MLRDLSCLEKYKKIQTLLRESKHLKQMTFSFQFSILSGWIFFYFVYIFIFST